MASKVEWIGIDVELPDYEEPVLATDGEEVYVLSRRSTDVLGEHWYLRDPAADDPDTDTEIDGITHWAQKPELPGK
jgi:hypothetical protein